MLSLPSGWQIRANALKRNLSNFSLLRHRGIDGAIVSMHQSGTHWLKYVLAYALAEKHGVEPPRYNHANEIIGGPHDRLAAPPLPKLIASHSIPPIWLTAPWSRRFLGLPPYVVLVRDIRTALVSNYAKWQQRYGVTFTEYLRGDPSERRYNSDLWWCIRFLNAWGRIAERPAQTTLLLRYEDLLADTEGELQRVSRFLNLDLSSQGCQAAITAGTRENMAARHDPARPLGEVSITPVAVESYFGSTERDYLARACERDLRYPMGYDYRV
jgi:hypothetical protein